MSRSAIETYLAVDSALNNTEDLPSFAPKAFPQITKDFEKLLHSIDLFMTTKISFPFNTFLAVPKKGTDPKAPVRHKDLDKHYTLVTPTAAQALLPHAVPSGFGKGSATLHDPTIRSAQEIPAKDLLLLHKDSTHFRPTGLHKLEKHLQSLDPRCTFHIKKLNIYSPGDFFSMHKDTPRSKTHIGTLVVLLSNDFEGGDFVVMDTFGHKKAVGLGKEKAGKEKAGNETAGKEEGGKEKSGKEMSWKKMTGVVIYTDVDHEVEVVKSGYRVSLSVDIELGKVDMSYVFSEGERITGMDRKALELPGSDGVREKFELICEKSLEKFGGKEVFGLLLYHQYVKGFSKETLKGIDKEFYLYFEKKGLELSLVPLVLRRRGDIEGSKDESGEEEERDPFKGIEIYKLPEFFVNPKDPSLEKFVKSGSSSSSEAKMKSKLKTDYSSSSDSEAKKTPLMVFTHPQMRLIKHIEGAEYTGNEGIEEENYYYMTALLIHNKKKKNQKKRNAPDSPETGKTKKKKKD